jgi:hypothetical protein
MLGYSQPILLLQAKIQDTLRLVEEFFDNIQPCLVMQVVYGQEPPLFSKPSFGFCSGLYQ